MPRSTPKSSHHNTIMYVCICMYVYIYIYTHICMYARMYIYIYIYIGLSLSIYIYIYIYHTCCVFLPQYHLFPWAAAARIACILAARLVMIRHRFFRKELGCFHVLEAPIMRHPRGHGCSANASGVLRRPHGPGRKPRSPRQVWRKTVLAEPLPICRGPTHSPA